jgi:hypothetical protein
MAFVLSGVVGNSKILKNAAASNSASQAPASAPPCKAWQEAAGKKETAARLRRLPPGVTFGDELDEPIFFDAAHQLLCYRGFMFHASYTYLHKLSPDPEYETAIDQLYMASAAANEGAGHGSLLTVLAIAAVVLTTAAAAWLLWLR